MSVVTTQCEVEVTIYEVACEDCGEGLTFTVRADLDGDLRIQVEPCESCIDRKAQELAGERDG